ncbi:hypothetical protein BD779DRAFT_1466260 [Infundibulicybe gibba]|nr:hypothetical protein BD779DRAFT_1466260 [Infundibulicybe gibba]
MFSRTVYSALLLAAPLLAVAGSVPKPTGETPLSQCNVDNVQCCKSTEEPLTWDQGLLGGLLGGGGLLSVVLGSLDAQVAKGCSPLSIVGSGNSWERFSAGMTVGECASLKTNVEPELSLVS